VLPALLGSPHITYESQTQDWLGGLAHVVIDHLLKTYQPTNRDAKVETQQLENGGY
jgi:hypothetical protein